MLFQFGTSKLLELSLLGRQPLYQSAYLWISHHQTTEVTIIKNQSLPLSSELNTNFSVVLVLYPVLTHGLALQVAMRELGRL